MPAAGAGGARAQRCLRPLPPSGSTLGQEDEPVLGQDTGARRPAWLRAARRPAAGDATTRSRTFALSKGLAARLSAASRPSGAGAVTATRYVFSFESAPFKAVDPPTMRSMIRVEIQEGRGFAGLFSRRATRVIVSARSSLDQLQEELRKRGRAVAELDNPRRPLRLREHPLRVDVAAREQPQVAVAPLNELDTGDIRQPLRGRAVELELDTSPLRAASQRAPGSASRTSTGNTASSPVSRFSPRRSDLPSLHW